MNLPTTLVHNQPDIYQGDVWDTEGHPIIQVQSQLCRTTTRGPADAREEANAGRQAIAAEVVRRWNMHQELVDLLRSARREWIRGVDLFTPMRDIGDLFKKYDQP